MKAKIYDVSLYFLVLLLVVVLIRIMQAAPENRDAQLEWVGSWPYGPVQSVAVDSARNLAFIGSGGAVMTLDITDPANPQMINKAIRTRGIVEDIAVDETNQRIILACDEGGYEIWDVQNTAAPQRLTRSEIIYGGVETPVHNVQLSGSIAIFECGWGYVNTVDISSPANPVQVSLNGVMGNPSSDIHLSADGYVHSTGAQYYVRLSLSAGGVLNNAGQREFLYGAGAVFGYGDVAFVSYGGSMYILDLLASGFLPWSITNVNGFTDIFVRDDLAYLTNQDGLQIWDVSSVQNPQFSDAIAIPGYDPNRKITLAGDYAYIAAETNGLYIVDVSNPSDISVAAVFHSPDQSGSVSKSGEYVFLSQGESGFSVIDVSDPIGNGPVSVAGHDSPGLAYESVIEGDYLYLADWSGGVRVFNISDPLNPVEVGSYTGIDVYRIAAAGQYVYAIHAIPNNPSELWVLDVSNPASPGLVTSQTMPAEVYKIVVKGNYLYAAARSAGVRILDISNPANPTEVANYPTPDAMDIYVEGNYAYVTDFDYSPPTDFTGALVILDVSNPANPVLAGDYYNFLFSPWDVVVEG
ncbi:MAG: hypothetical protein WAN36_00955, partial [Calditrichia bacterium]